MYYGFISLAQIGWRIVTILYGAQYLAGISFYTIVNASFSSSILVTGFCQIPILLLWPLLYS